MNVNCFWYGHVNVVRGRVEINVPVESVVNDADYLLDDRCHLVAVQRLFKVFVNEIVFPWMTCSHKSLRVICQYVNSFPKMLLCRHECLLQNLYVCQLRFIFWTEHFVIGDIHFLYFFELLKTQIEYSFRNARRIAHLSNFTFLSRFTLISLSTALNHQFMILLKQISMVFFVQKLFILFRRLILVFTNF